MRSLRINNSFRRSLPPQRQRRARVGIVTESGFILNVSIYSICNASAPRDYRSKSGTPVVKTGTLRYGTTRSRIARVRRNELRRDLLIDRINYFNDVKRRSISMSLSCVLRFVFKMGEMIFLYNETVLPIRLTL